MTPLVEELRVALDRDSAKLVAELLTGVPEAERAPCRTLLKHYRENRFRDAWVVAAAGLESGAVAVARRLRSASPPTSWLPIAGYHPDQARTSGARAWPLVADVLLDRQVAWLPDLVTRLAEVDPRGWGDDRQVLTERLRLALDLPRPCGAGYLRWVVQQRLSVSWRRDDRSTAERLRAEPDPDALVAAVLTVPGIGTELDVRRGEHLAQWGPEGWHAALRETLADGTLDRDRFLDALLGALLVGGPVAHQHDLAVVLADTRVSPEQTATRVREFCALVPESTGPVAGAALDLVRAAVAGEVVTARGALAATSAASHRREKGLVRTHVRWLVDLARQHPDLRDDVLLALAEVFAHEHHDLARQAWDAVDGLRDGATGAVLDHLRHRSGDLPPDVRGRAGQALGGVPDAAAREAADTADDDFAPLPPAPHPPRVHDLDELVEAIVQHSRHGRPGDAERVLDGMARFGARDLGALVAALDPVADRFALSWERTPHFAVHPFLAAVTRRPGAPRWRGERPPPPGPLPAGGEGVLALRAQEVVDRVRAGESSPLLSFPDTAVGHVDPDRVLEDLQRAAATGTAPWPADLEQTWLRFPRTDLAPSYLDRLRSVGAPAADWLLQQLTAARPEALATAEPVPERGSRSGYRVAAEGAGRPAVSLSGPDARTPLARQGLDGTGLPAQVVGLWWWGGGWEAAYALSCLPSHREVAAGHLVAALVNTEQRREVSIVSALAALPEAQGPTGRATHLAVAYALLSSDERVRLAALDALGGFTAGGGLDAPAAGAVLGELLTLEEVKPVRVARTLAPLAHADRPQVRGFVARYLLAALTTVLPLQRKGCADLLALAADACHETGPHPRVSGLAEVVAAGGRSRLVAEARRLLPLTQP
ncbi:hypothetical protein AB2L27_00645 [Kineococcus sp. LSe6-4]|uniref:HEAT repeat domain-containing protein n=1 Tax=Kineococcus halophytocola TaxID=3234027 RepID=A0ABV4GXD0_9ACTN